MTIGFTRDGQEFTALNGGPMFKFTEAISLVVNCEDQQEVDAIWDKLLTGGGQESQCGWLKDRFGLSWQVVPKGLGKLLSEQDPKKSQKVMAELMKMKKLDLGKLEAAARG